MPSELGACDESGVFRSSVKSSHFHLPSSSSFKSCHLCASAMPTTRAGIGRRSTACHWPASLSPSTHSSQTSTETCGMRVSDKVWALGVYRVPMRCWQLALSCPFQEGICSLCRSLPWCTPVTSVESCHRTPTLEHVGNGQTYPLHQQAQEPMHRWVAAKGLGIKSCWHHGNGLCP